MTITKQKVSLNPVKAPALPIAPGMYDPLQQEQLLNALRLYFRGIDNWTQVVAGRSGGVFINSPHLFMSDSTSQYAPADNTPTLVQWNTVERNQSFIVNGTGATPELNGAYRISYRLQFENSDTVQHDAWVWIRVNEVDVSRSAAKFSIPASGTEDGYLVAVGEVVMDITGADEVQMYWATSKFGNSSGSIKGVYLEAYPEQTTPFPCPAIPSAYGSITFVSSLIV